MSGAVAAASPPPRRHSALDIVILGLSITSSWGNGHATTFRGLVRALCQRGHRVLFLERDQPWYADNRDLPRPPFGRTELYNSLDELREGFGSAIRDADLVMLGSFVPEGARIGAWVQQVARGLTAFYDIDTPVTAARLARGEWDYVSPALVPRFDLYLSFTGGPLLEEIARRYGARRVQPLYCAADPELHRPQRQHARWDLGYLGTYSADRQPALEQLLLGPARVLRGRSFAVAGPQYPESVDWPANVDRIAHLPPAAHPSFYTAQRFTLNITRAVMVAAGHSPSVRLFEAAACGTPVISDPWPGLERFFAPGREILIARSTEEALGYLRGIAEAERRAIGARARARVLAEHTGAHRAATLEQCVGACHAHEPAWMFAGGG
jgi:spore maturation protein CgeB